MKDRNRKEAQRKIQRRGRREVALSVSSAPASAAYGKGINELHLRIFNRWGELVFESFKQSDGWDGTYRGKRLDPDVFAYEVRVTFCDGSVLPEDNPYKTGSVTLIQVAP